MISVWRISKARLWKIALGSPPSALQEAEAAWEDAAVGQAQAV